MDIIVRITDSSVNTGPTFNLYSNVDNYTTAFVTNVSKASLLSGYYTNLAPANTVTVRVKSVGSTCNNYIDVSVLPPTTTTTTTYPVTVDFTLEIVTNNLYANPAISISNFTGASSGKYTASPRPVLTQADASNSYFYVTPPDAPLTYLLYYYAGNNQPPTNYGWPPGTYWVGVRDFDNYLNMKVKSITVPATTTTTTTLFPPSTTTTTTTLGQLDFTLTSSCLFPSPSPLNPTISTSNYTGVTSGSVYFSAQPKLTESEAIANIFTGISYTNASPITYSGVSGYTVGQTYWVAMQDASNPSRIKTKSVVIVAC